MAVYVLTAILAIVTNLATEVLPESWRPYQWVAWPLLFLLVISGVLLVAAQSRSSAESRRPVTPERDSFGRRAMLSRMRRYWVDEVLRQSLHQQTIVELGLQERPDVLRRTWSLVLEEQDRVPRPMDPGVTLADVVEQHRGGLLVLGAPGAGKTTMLLTLLDDLLNEAARYDTTPIPVMFRLSTWTSSGGRALEQWIVDELCGPLYGVPRDLAEQWVADERVLPLLDGLDEVASDDQRACVRAIDAFHAAHRLLPLVVSSRAADYEALDLRLSLGAALVIQPLSPTQIEDYLDRLGEPVIGLREALREEPSLWELLQTPFLLNVAVHAYRGKPVEEISKGDPLPQRQSRLIAAYVERALRRKDAGARYNPDDAVRWLTFIARTLGRRLENFFVVEMADLSWLSPPRRSLIALLTAIPGGVLAGGAIGMLMGLFFDPVVGITSGIFVAIAFGIPLVRFGDRPALKCITFNDRSKFPDNRRNTLINDVFRTLSFVAWFAPVLGVLGLALGAFVGAVVSLIAGSPFLGTSLRGALAGPVLMAMASVLVIISMPPPRYGRQNLRHRPSGSGFRDAVWFALVPGVIVSAQASSTLIDAYGANGLLGGVLLGCAVGYLYSGRGLLGHWLAHLVLAQTGGVPKSLSSFLDFTTNQTLMLKVGSGYMFAHRLLLEYFAGLEFAGATGTSPYVLPAVLDLRPEVLLAQAVKDVKGARGGIVRTLEHVSSALPSNAWVPAAVRIAATLRAEIPAAPSSPFPSAIDRYIRQNRELSEVLWLIAQAKFGEISAATTVELGELIWLHKPKQLSFMSPQQLVEITGTLRAIAAGNDPDLAARARAVIDEID
ncbi:MAG: NACHT domain-containing protein [Saccharothrix sp.]|nr:NACHT domain-containing protein [Saccharothrix sp.]